MLNSAIIVFIKTYQKTFSKILPGACRFYPTCSNYSIEVFQKYNIFKATLKTIIRILKCNPLHPGGHDPT